MKNLEPMELWTTIRDNEDLRKETLNGLKRGHERGKSMNYNTETLRISLQKQIIDWQHISFRALRTSFIEEKQKLADIINNASLLFLRLDGKL